jgi:IS30 family transposase
MLKIKKANTREAAEVEKAIIELLEDWSPFIFRTMTVDNRKKFANHRSITQNTGLDIYFTKPYHSWQRGSNENLNGLIRQYIPKKTDFSLISDKYIC